MPSNLFDGPDGKELREAAQKGDVTIVKELLDKGAAVTSSDKYGCTALHHASKNGHLGVVRVLLGHEACDVNASDKYGLTALHRASVFGQLDVVRVLLGHEACDVNALTKKGGTALHYASEDGQLDVVRVLLGHEACEVNASDKDGKTALHDASVFGQLDVVRVLLGHEACEVNASDKDGKTALHYASRNGQLDVVRVLLGHEACEVNASDKNGETALHDTSRNGKAEVVRALLDRGLNPHLRNKDGHTPLALCFQLNPLEWRSDKEQVFWGALETTHALLSSGVAYDGHPEILLPVEEDNKVRAAILSMCVRHWTEEQRREKRSLTAVPFEVFRRGLKAVETYLMEFGASDKKDLVWRRKVCVVGSSNAGKTSLVKSITSMTPELVEEDDRTIGVDLFRLDFSEDVKSNPATEQKFHAVTFWDFAGQDEYNVARTLFFSRRTLYLLCVDVGAFDEVVCKAHACEDDDDAESLVLAFVQDHVWRWFRLIFAHQPDAEFVLIATKTDVLGTDVESRLKDLESELIAVVKELKYTFKKEIQREIKVLHERAVNGKAESSSDERIKSLQSLQVQLESSVPCSWTGLNVRESSSTQRARTCIEDVVKKSNRSFVMPDKYSRVLEKVEELRQKARQTVIMKNRIRQSFISLPDLVKALMADILDLKEVEAKTILEILHDLGDVLWYARDGHHMLGDTIVLDAELLIDFIRQIVCHDPAKISGASNSGDDESAPLIQAMSQHGTVSNELLRHKFSWWKRLAYPEQLLQFKLLLQHFNLAYPAGGDVMQADSDLIVPAYWRVRGKQIDLGQVVPLSVDDIDSSNTKHYLWEYYLGDNSSVMVDTVFEQIAVRSYDAFPNRVIHGLRIESVQKGRRAIRIACGVIASRGLVIHLEVLGKDDYNPSAWLRAVHEAIESVLTMFPGMLVTRNAIAGRHSCNLDDCIPRWRVLPDNQREAKLHEHSWLPDGVIEWFRRAVRDWYISPESIVKRKGPALAKGGFGVAYIARWQHTDVVVKEMSTSEMRRFLWEVTLWCKLRHPNVVQFLGANDKTEPFFIVSTYASNGELLQFLASEKKKGRVVMWRKLYEAAAGLSHLHTRGIVHGDLKGDNILVNESGAAMLVDFGLSFSEAGSSSVVTEKETLGAMAWRAPEFANLTVERPTRKSDVFSLGMCVVEVVTGEKPWGKGIDNYTIRECLRNGEVKVAKPDAMTDAQWKLVQQMIAPSPSDRPELSEGTEKPLPRQAREKFAEFLAPAAFGCAVLLVSSVSPMDDLLCNDETLVASTSIGSDFAPRDESLSPVEVIRHMAKREGEYGQCKATYLKEVQVHGMEAMWRQKICRWMFETAKAFELTKDTVGCAVYFMDRYLSSSSVDKIMLQLVSMVSMYIASKMHEQQPISMEEMYLLSQRKFSRDDIRRVEAKLLKLLDWRLSPPSTFMFARDFIQVLELSEDAESGLQEHVVSFLQEITEEYGSLRFKSSSIGIAAVHVLCNVRKVRPSSSIQDAIRSLEVVGEDFVDCYRWLREIQISKHQPTRFVSVEESKTTDLSRSVSPTGVDDVTAAAVDEVTIEEVTSHGKVRASSTPEGDVVIKKARRTVA
ncbi:hypothetical protein Poli38472_004317 [Pythium oligandrum]|uniref:Protein kinase domain-containing protein n=1 Tax=Pythium oligandrum TaxID=41045 RepID=A0A8K1CQ16_PYTOL|nr:hypothetical protein Poli38472_004317 [Pythium oligandrum]|eukprot:TMW66552.1 hypothetical protein Poli38472_004317 [Pythium oligandrum]